MPKDKVAKVVTVDVVTVDVGGSNSLAVDRQAEFTRNVSIQNLHFRAGQRVMVAGISGDKVKIGKAGLFYWVSKDVLKAV